MKNDVKDNNHCWVVIQSNRYILLIISILLLSLLEAQQGKYDRKSISSLGMIWDNGELKVVDENYKNLINSYIEVSRFDYNILPKRIVSHFYEKSINIDDLNEIESLLEETVIQDVVKILNDPDIKMNRGLALKDESDFQSFAMTKAKSLGITVKEISQIMNSAYIYMPFITKSQISIRRPFFYVPLVFDRLKYEVEGGIIWWKITTDSDGNPNIQKIETYHTKGVASASIGLRRLFSLWGGRLKYDREKLEEDIYESASMAFVRNMSTKSKEIEDFNLTGQIVEADGRMYKVPIGKKEGLRLDDGFHIAELYEDKDGETKIKKNGFGRVVKTGNNINNPNNLTTVRQSIGKKVSEGSIILEHPRSNILIDLQYGESSLYIPKTIFSHINRYGLNNVAIFKEDITSARNFSMMISYNISSIVNRTQTFLEFNYGVLVVDRSYLNKSAVDGGFSITSPYFSTGLTRKFGFGRSNFGFGLAFGWDQISMNGDIYLETGPEVSKPGSYGFNFTTSYFGSILSTEYELLLTPDLSFNLEISSKMTQGASIPDSIGLQVIEYYSDEDGFPVYGTLDPGDIENWPNIMDGMTVKVGLSYTPKTLPFKWGGWLDKHRKY
jgi:hypothetical protein